MLIKKEIGNEDLAKVYICQIDNKIVECAESTQPPLSLQEKWVLITSCLSGCPVQCLMCDAGQVYQGKLTKEEILAQIESMVTRRFPERKIPVKKFKVQFTRMGEPAFNDAVLDVLEELPALYHAPGLMPSVSTIGPKGCASFFTRLREIKNRLYPNGRFQLQFSIHSTDLQKRDVLIPVSKMSFQEVAEYGKIFFSTGDRKITLNFIVLRDYPIDPAVIYSFFDPALFLIKLTPLNPTISAKNNRLSSRLDPHDEHSISELVHTFRSLGFETLVSIGELEENKIGSNCGQYLSYLP